MEYLLEKQIADLVQNCVLHKDPDQKIWRASRTGYAMIHNRPFEKLKTWVRHDHLMPEDMLPGAESVVTFFLPFTEEITCSNNEGVPASRTWGEAYIQTNNLIKEINDEITSLLEVGGFNCFQIPATHNFDKESLTSRWSHRHIAYLSGLGTFGKNNLLITESGCSGRLGSLITDAPLSSTPLPVEEFCIEKRGEKCGVCVDRCAKGALTRENYDRHSCYEQCLDNGKNLGTKNLMDVCGKCLTKLPCTFTVPA
jgi:epoxyqueuosine reductase QueG